MKRLCAALALSLLAFLVVPHLAAQTAGAFDTPGAASTATPAPSPTAEPSFDDVTTTTTVVSTSTAPLTPGEIESMLVSILAGLVLGLVIAIGKAIPVFSASASKGSFANKAIVPVALLVGIGFAAVKSAAIGPPIVDEASWNALLLRGVEISAMAAGFRSWVKTFGRPTDRLA